MNESSIVCLFSGQGSYYQGVLETLQEDSPRVREIFDMIDEEASRIMECRVTPVLFSTPSPSLESIRTEAPDIMPLIVYGISVVVCEELKQRGVSPDILCGHSLGEHGALVCGGAFSIRQGAELLSHRQMVLKQHLAGDTGEMAAFGIGTGRARDLVRIVGEDHCSVAVENHTSQTVISGTSEAIDSLVQIAKILNILVKRLHSAYAYHCPAVMQPVIKDYAARIRHIHSKPLQIPVFSPILGRYYSDQDMLTECLAEQLVQPVRFSEAIQHFYTNGARIFIECGALKTLSVLVKNILRDPMATAIPCLDPAINGNSFTYALQLLGTAGVLSRENERGLRESLLPEVSPEAFDQFWRQHGPKFIATVRNAFYGNTRSPVPMPRLRQTEKREDILPGKDQPGPSRDTIYTELVSMYARALEYPEEVFEEDIDLEGELGVDSVKQMELFSRIQEQYSLPPLPEDFRLQDCNTMGKVTNLVYHTLCTTHE